MNIKLTTSEQVALLKEGDIINRFPYNAADGPQDKYDESRTKNILSYEVRSVNPKNGMLSLIVSNFRTVVASPVDIGRLFIRNTDLIKESVWWVNA